MSTIISYTTKGTCARSIELEIEGNVVKQARFVGGCHGNTQGVAALVKGMSVDEVIARLDGIRCGSKPTSCPDQLACALREYKSKAND